MAHSKFESDDVNPQLSQDTIPLAAIGVVLLRRLRFLIFTAFVFAMITLVALLLQARRYTAEASFVLQGQLGRSGLSGIAAQFGLSVPTADASSSPLFFEALAKTRPVLGAVADSAPSVLNGKTLETLFDVNPGSTVHRRADAIKALDNALGTSVSTKTGIVELTLATPEPAASAALLASLVRTIDRFNRQSQQTQAGAQRKFTEERVNATQQELRAAEDRLQSFRARNRVAGSPNLTLDEERLDREVQAAQSLHSSLQQAMEQARIEELRNTPVITLLETPVTPLDPDPRHAGRYAFVSAIFGGLIAGVVVLLSGLDTVRGLTDREARTEFVQRLRAPWRK